MHVRGARRMGARGQARGAHERSSRSSALGRLVRGCERRRAAARAATGVLFTREHVLHPKSPK
ncbi:hypothetical protein CRG98_009948 [Punica granatum]|uniref:Uncharacterized protein n=1 Tax=Punica granatum TaxID=22663 RepID=A0A2I0KMF4_PUNGR|nr:hypothetical protein CRG98_009948 [Punica granatum]